MAIVGRAAAGFLREAPCKRRFAAAARLPDTMKAAVWRGDRDPSRMRVETLRMPVPHAGEILVKTKACGVCHTDLHCIKGEVPFPSPAVFGHEISGTVAAVGEGVTSVELGAKVVCSFIMPCGDCHFCHLGEEDTCTTFFQKNRLKGTLYDDTTRLYTAESGEPLAMYSFGGLAEYAVVPQTAVFALPQEAEHMWRESAILGCAFFTAIGAVRNAARLVPGESVCVIGCGGVGAGVIQIAKHMGASPVVAIDVSDTALALARDMGADHTINSSHEDAIARIVEITGGLKVDVCFEVIGLKQTFEQAMQSVRDGGKACYIGIADVNALAEVPITQVVRRRISLIGSYGGRASTDMPALLAIFAAGGIDAKAAITKHFSLEESPAAYAMMAAGKLPGRGLVVFD